MTLIQWLKNGARLPFNFYAANFGEHHRKRDEPRLWVLMYHRILPKNDPRHALEEPGMIVEPDTFRMHLKIVKQLFTPVTLGGWLKKYQHGEALPAKACAITFDDGWKDNYEYAFPVLKEQNVPATLFAVSNMIGTTREFWPNRFAKLVARLSPEQIANEDILRKAMQGRDKSDPEAIASAINSLKQLSDAEIIDTLQALESKYNVPEAEASLMNWQELQEMVASGLLEPGSHTRNHMRLKENLDRETLIREITDSKRVLEEKLKQPVKLFCYPNGDTSKLALETVKANYDAAVTTARGINSLGKIHPHTLCRVPIHNDAADTPIKFKARLACTF